MLICDRCKGEIKPGQNVELVGQDASQLEGDFIVAEGGAIVVHANSEECVLHKPYVLILYAVNDDGSTGELIEDPVIVERARAFTGLPEPTDSNGWGIWFMMIPSPED